ncbi:antibiotic biosynthesis monooxygenase [Dyadobacter sp. CY345]|uniref:putative quinol monooxygenase n=1 Tax=Dyadobacter sp. CY345 TaxID=2909335 RepID=UPI001F15C7AF|nr:putative quinol monooxygenase [Dyadobacter sp. CY345]MCF2447730.1 antibiotic biosynthesis monooxygenase [Dyadobacter sp. CY345]
MSIYLTAFVKSKPGKSEDLKVQLLNLVANSTKEAACIQYDLHQSNEEPDVFIFHEEWESQAGLDVHNASPYISDFITLAPDLIEGNISIYKTSKIG